MRPGERDELAREDPVQVAILHPLQRAQPAGVRTVNTQGEPVAAKLYKECVARQSGNGWTIYPAVGFDCIEPTLRGIGTHSR